MRKIMFKAKSINGHWVYGLPTHDNTIVDSAGLTHEIKKETLCQFIGQYDKNKNEIFEFDHIQFEDDLPLVVTIEQGLPNVERIGYRPKGTILRQSNSSVHTIIGNQFD